MSGGQSPGNGKLKPLHVLHARQCTATEVVQRWDVIWQGLKTILDPRREAQMQQAFVRGELHAWALEMPGPDGLNLVGLAVTTIMGDPYMGLRNLVVYGLFVNQVVMLEAWKSLEDSLVQFARMMECNTIYAETDNPRVQQIAEAMGFTAQVSLRRRVN